MDMNRVKDDRREQGETWAHYITRAVGEDNFDKLYELHIGLGGEEASLGSSIETSNIYFDVDEVIREDDQEGIKTLKEARVLTNVLIGRFNSGDAEPEIVSSIKIYPDNTIEIDDYDPTQIPPDAKASIEQYEKEEDVQEFVDGIVDFARKLSASGRRIR